ncbi:DUF805 domain-containing protein [Bombella mellum]|uniref:DUF805 domain-containing protein n=1 Tax=Bombella mellum TaxID=2039288 RepID=A0ABR5ZU83_9PROT|nr:DUF805 domain-containing protein [Bombella mellum]MBA5727808.1 hypothetical protein [Bombella mellum]
MSYLKRQSSFSRSLHHCFANYCNFMGRTSRADFWLFFLLLFLTGIFFSLIVGTALIQAIMAMPHPPYNTEITAYIPLATSMTFYLYFISLMYIVYWVSLIPFMSACVRRLHDAGRSGWWLLLSLTIVGLLPLFIFFCLRSEPHENRYGHPPYNC